MAANDAAEIRFAGFAGTLEMALYLTYVKGHFVMKVFLMGSVMRHEPAGT